MKLVFIAVVLVLSVAVFVTLFVRNSQKKPKILMIVPLDGLVIETNGAFWPAVRQVLEANGVVFQGFDQELLYALTGQSLSAVCQYLRNRFDLRADVSALEQSLSKFILSNLASKTELVDGFDDFVKNCEQIGGTVAVRTGMDKAHLDILDKKFDLRKSFGSGLYVRDNASSDSFLLNIAKDHCVEPAKCVVLCKRSVDAEEPMALGMHTIVLNYSKSVANDGSVVASLKPFQQLFVEIQQFLND